MNQSDVLLQDLQEHMTRRIPPGAVAAAHRDFSYLGHAKVSFLAPDSVKRAIAAEVDAVIGEAGVRREVAFAETGYTPRRMRNVTRQQIAERGTVIKEIYTADPILEMLSVVAGEPVLLCPYEPEQFVITCLEKEGDTHGWHWDDYTFALVWVVECPPVEDGGFVQCVPGTAWRKQRPDINKAFVTRPIYSMELAAGDMYLMRTNTTLHRVYPIRSGRRKIINMGYASAADLNASFSHETMDGLWATTRQGKGDHHVDGQR